MLSFDQLVYEIELTEPEAVLKYLENFFVFDNYAQYLIDEKSDSNDKESILKMFQDKEPILQRANTVLNNNNFCIEAFFVCYCLSEETSLNVFMNNMYHKQNEYKLFSEYQKNNYLRILSFYVQFLINIHNITFAIKVLKTIIKLEENYSDIYVSRLAYLYCLIENKDDFYDLYLNVGFRQITPYILLMIVLLKHEEELKAKEVFSELLSKFEYAEYIDHIWDLDDVDDEEAIEFKNIMELCFEEICAIPYFFSWCSDNKELSLRS